MNGTIIEEMSHLSCWFPGTLVLTLVYVPDALVDADRAAFYADLGFAEREGDRLTITPQGMPLLDALLAELVPAHLVAA